MMKKKTKIKLEVGKFYQDRTGRVVEIISDRNTEERPYLDNDYCAFHEDGSFNVDKEESDYDLIEEVKSTTTTTDPQGVYEAKYLAVKNNEVSNLEHSLRKHICGLVSMGKYQDAKELLNILIEEEKSCEN